jgi:hypothetical protein
MVIILAVAAEVEWRVHFVVFHIKLLRTVVGVTLDALNMSSL